MWNRSSSKIRCRCNRSELQHLEQGVEPTSTNGWALGAIKSFQEWREFWHRLLEGSVLIIWEDKFSWKYLVLTGCSRSRVIFNSGRFMLLSPRIPILAEPGQPVWAAAIQLQPCLLSKDAHILENLVFQTPSPWPWVTQGIKTGCLELGGDLLARCWTYSWPSSFGWLTC